MARATTKLELVNDATTKFDKLFVLINEMSIEDQEKTFNFEDRDRNLKDVLVHLYEWHKLLLNWVDTNMNGTSTNFLPEPYNWRTYPEMNIEIQKKHKDTTLSDAKEMVIKTHNELLTLLERFNDEELFTKKYFSWTASATLGSYFVSTMPSHYDWAMKKIKKHIKTIER